MLVDRAWLISDAWSQCIGNSCDLHTSGLAMACRLMGLTACGKEEHALLLQSAHVTKRQCLLVASQLVGIYKRLGSPIGLAIMMLDRAKGRAWASKVLSWDFDTILMSHLTPVITEDAQKEFMRCFDFVLRPSSKDNK